MAETRMLPQHVRRSTGIVQTNTQKARPPSGSGAGPNSHISSSPGASRATHDHAAAARSAGVGAPRAQAARVEVIGGSGSSGGQAGTRSVGGMNVKTTVQLIDRKSGTSPNAEARTSGPVTPPFTREQSMLAISLLEQYAERAKVIGSPDAEVAVAAARIHQEMLLAGRAQAAIAPPVRFVDPRIPTAPAAVDRAASPDGRARAHGEATDHAATHPPLGASTPTTIAADASVAAARSAIAATATGHGDPGRPGAE
jgi:hypothetical protein